MTKFTIPSDRLFNRSLSVLVICQALMMTINSTLITTAALVGMSLATHKALATLPIALQFIATMTVTIPASLLMQKIGRRLGFICGACLAIIGTGLALMGITQASFAWFCAGVALNGAFNAFAVYFRFAAVEAVSQQFKSRAISFVMAGGVVAAFAGPNLAHWSKDWLDSGVFAGTYAALMVIAVVICFALCFLQLGRAQLANDIGPARPLIRIAVQPSFIVASLCSMLGYGIMSLVMTATPLAMQTYTHPFSDTAFVIQWHVLGMFAPAFFTGQIIEKFGVLRVMLVGALCGFACIAINLNGTGLWHFWTALVLLGISWNFLFIGGTNLLTETYQVSERGKAQALNDFMVWSMVSVAALSAGALHHKLGWQGVNWGVIPMLSLITITLIALIRARAKTECRAKSA